MARTSDLRRKILEQARSLLLAEGYAQVSMRKIANAVGCTPTSIYLYFDSKDVLFHSLIEEGMIRLHEQLETVVSLFPDPEDRFRRLCRGYLEFGLENPEFYEIMFLLHPEQMMRYPTDKYRKARRNLQFFADAIAASRCDDPDRDPILSATVVWSLLHGAISLHLAKRVDISLSTPAFVEQVVEHSVQMLQPQNP